MCGLIKDAIVPLFPSFVAPRLAAPVEVQMVSSRRGYPRGPWRALTLSLPLSAQGLANYHHHPLPRPPLPATGSLAPGTMDGTFPQPAPGLLFSWPALMADTPADPSLLPRPLSSSPPRYLISISLPPSLYQLPLSPSLTLTLITRGFKLLSDPDKLLLLKREMLAKGWRGSGGALADVSEKWQRRWSDQKLVVLTTVG